VVVISSDREGAAGNLPHKLWHNVPMANAALIPTPTSETFVFDWKQVEQGAPLAALEEFAVYSGFAVKDFLEVVIPLRTLKHRRQRKEALNLEETERLARVARIFDLTLKVWNNKEDAREWLSTPNHRFEERTPLAMLRSQAGERAVEEFLYQIDEGMFV